LGTSHAECGSGAEIALAALAHWHGKDLWRSSKSFSQEEETMKTAIAFLIFGALAGGRVRITTTNPAALKTIHEFLRF
jgi:hypothetical protein